MNGSVVVVIGSGAMGVAVARRLAAGQVVLLADRAPDRMDGAVRSLADEGHRVQTAAVDVADPTSVGGLVDAAGRLGRISAVVHTAGIAPSQGGSEEIVRVNLVGTANVLDQFLELAGPGMTLTCISSMAGHKFRVDAELERLMATTPACGLAALPELALDPADPSHAYDIAKRGAQVRVQAAATAYGARGARVNSISPGIISTPMSRAEFDGPHGDFMRSIVDGLPIPRVGSAEDIADAVAFLSSSAAAYVTGTDLLVDGGAVAALRWPGSRAAVAPAVQ